MPAKKGYYHKLREKWSKRHEELQTSLWTKHKESFDWLSKNTKQIAATSLGSLILLTSPGSPTLHLPENQSKDFPLEIDNRVFLISELYKLLPQEVRELTPEEEEQIGGILSRDFGVKAFLMAKDLTEAMGL